MKTNTLVVGLNPALLNSLLIGYVCAVYLAGVGLLLFHSWLLNAIGVVLTVHGLVLSTVLTHEFLHDSIFKQRHLNRLFGQIMTHINGACYAPYEDLVQNHFHHHIYHSDIVPFEIPTFFNELSKPIRYLFVALEWAYFPLFEFILRWRSIVAPFKDEAKRHLRGKNLAIMTYRGGLALIIGLISWQALLLYFFAYVCFINLMRFVDAFHHTYDYAVFKPEFTKHDYPTDRLGDRLYEQANTFSNLVSYKYPWLNLFYLNFGYHNAHHHDMRCPWYRLPELHQKLYGNEAKNLLPLSRLINNYHRFRIARLSGSQGNVDTENERNAIASFTGGIGVSLLTPP